MRLIVALLAVVVASNALASQPGQPLGCDDWEFFVPGLSCELILGPEPYAGAELRSGSTNAIDNDGNLYHVTLEQGTSTCWGLPGVGAGIVLRRLEQDAVRTVGRLAARCGSFNTWDESRFLPVENTAAGGTYYGIITSDPIRGRLLIPAWLFCSRWSPGGECSYQSGYWLFAIGGLTTMADVFLSYESVPAAWGFRRPVHPEGLRAVDRFDTYWGSVTQPLDLASAQPLQCAYPSSPPSVGDYLQITAPVPTPPPGSANYVLTSVSYQGETRAGRKRTVGRLTGRDASRLPACVIE